MSETELNQQSIEVPGAPAIADLRFRHYAGACDLPALRDVMDGARSEDGTEWVPTVEEIARNYEHLVNCDPACDLLIAQVNGQVVAYSRVSWQQLADGDRIFEHFVHMLPAWRPTGLRQAMARWNEQRLQEIASEHVGRAEGFPPGRQWLQASASGTETHWASIVQEMGYQPARFAFAMVRPLQEPIPDLPLPPGLELRPAQPEHFRPIWDAMSEAFRDHWGYSPDEWCDERFEVYRGDNLETYALWQVAWDGDRVAGAVHTFIDAKQNEEYQRARGYTEGIFVRREWRRKGVAKALIARSLRVLKEQGMAEAALGVDADNPNGALQLYRSLGYREVKRYTTYRKEIRG